MKRGGATDEQGGAIPKRAVRDGANAVVRGSGGPAACARITPGAAGLAVWALEPYFGGSHRSFLEGLACYSSHEVALLTMPGRNWKWRMHGGALTLARRALERHRETGEPPQVFVASDMLDLPVLLAAVTPTLGRIPTLLYFHENQLTYPLPPGVERDLGYGFKNLAGALLADIVLFNSEFHRREFLAAASDLLAAMPDEVPSWVMGEVEARASVLPVGCDLRRFECHRARALAESAGGRWGDPSRRAPASLESALGVRQGA